MTLGWVRGMTVGCGIGCWFGVRTCFGHHPLALLGVSIAPGSGLGQDPALLPEGEGWLWGVQCLVVMVGEMEEQ